MEADEIHHLRVLLFTWEHQVFVFLARSGSQTASLDSHTDMVPLISSLGRPLVVQFAAHTDKEFGDAVELIRGAHHQIHMSTHYDGH
jgi:hypothetical protein